MLLEPFQAAFMFYTSTDFLESPVYTVVNVTLPCHLSQDHLLFQFYHVAVGFFFFLTTCSPPCVSLVSRPGIEPAPLALEAQSLNYWATSEVPRGTDFISSVFQNR